MDIKQAVKNTVAVLALIYLANQFQPTRRLVQTALNG